MDQLVFLQLGGIHVTTFMLLPERDTANQIGCSADAAYVHY